MRNKSGKIDEIDKLAKEEIENEILDNAKDKLKAKYEDLNKAKRIVANLERDIKELKLEIAQELGE